MSGQGVVLNLSKNHEKFADEIRDKATKILESGMPDKIVRMNELIAEYAPNLDASEFSKSTTVMPEPQVKRLKRAGSDEHGGNEFCYPNKIPTNPAIVKHWEILRSETLEILEMVAALKLWIQLNVPKIEDGNNFGVGIQEETIGELSRAEESASQVLDTGARYHATRAKLMTKCIKYPETNDYELAVRELDEKQFVNMKICFIDLRNNYAILYDQMSKNMQKLLKPRGETQCAVSYMY